MQASNNWNLDTIFEGGVKAPDFTQKIELLRSKVETFVQRAEALPCLGEKDEDWVEGLYKLVEKRFSNAITG